MIPISFTDRTSGAIYRLAFCYYKRYCHAVAYDSAQLKIMAIEESTVCSTSGAPIFSQRIHPKKHHQNSPTNPYFRAINSRC